MWQGNTSLKVAILNNTGQSVRSISVGDSLIMTGESLVPLYAHNCTLETIFTAFLILFSTSLLRSSHNQTHKM